MVLTRALRARLLLLLRPWLREDPFFELKLGFLSSTGAAKDLLLDPSPLNPLIESSTRLMFKTIKIAEVTLRISPWSSSSVTVDVRGVDVTLSPREIAEGGRPVSAEEFAEREMQEALAAIDPEGVAVHEMIRDAISVGSGTSPVAMALRDSLLQRLQIRFQDVSFRLELTDDSYYCLMKVSELALGPHVPSRSGLLGGFFRAFFGPWSENLLGISCHALEIRIQGNGLDECLAFVKDSCVGISLSGSETPGFYVHIPRAKVGFTPSQIPVLLVVSYMLSPEVRQLSRSGRDLWKLAACGMHRLKSHPRASLLEAFGTSVAWVRYVRAYKALISLVGYHHKKGVPAKSVNCLSGMQKCLHCAAHELNVVNRLEKKLPPVAVFRARRIARNSVLSKMHCCNMQWTEHLRIISLWNLVVLFLSLCKLIYYILYWISHIFLPLWNFFYFFGGKIIPSSPLSCFNLPSYGSLGCMTVDVGDLDVRVSHSPVNRKEDTLPMSSNFIFLSFHVSIKSLFFTHRKDTQFTYLIVGKLQVHSCSKSSTSCNLATDEESPCSTDIKSHVILWCEQALHHLSGKASDSAEVISGICQQILENSSLKLLSDLDMILSEMKGDQPEHIVHPFALCRLENLSRGSVNSNNDGLLQCDLMVGRIHLSLGFDSISTIFLLVMEIWHSLYAIEESSVPVNSVLTSQKELLEPEEYLDYYTTKMKMVMLGNIFKRSLHIIAVMGGTDLELIMEQNDLKNQKGTRDDNVVTEGQGSTHFLLDLRAFEIAIWPASKDAMRNLGIDLEFNELPECLWLVEPRLAPALPQSESSIFSSLFHVRQNIFLNFGHLAVSWKNSGDDQKYPVLGPISVTICSSTSRNTYLSFSTVANALSLASRGTTVGATALFFIDELSSMFQALESMYSLVTYVFVKGDSILAHKELIMKFLSRTPKNSLGKNVLQNNVTAGQKDDNLVLENTLFATDVSFDMRSLDMIFGHSRKLKFTGKSNDSFSTGSFYPDSNGDLSNSSLGIFFQKSHIKISWDSQLLNVLINFSGVESTIFKNQSGRGILRGLIAGKSSESQQFEQLYYFSFSASKFGFFAGRRGIELAPRNADSSSGYTFSINSEMAKPGSVLGDGLEACLSFSGENELPSCLNSGSDSWASLCVVLGDIIIVATDVKNLVTAMHKPSELELLLSISGKPPEINCEAKGGNIVIETSALVAFINYSRVYSTCLAVLLSRTHHLLEQSKKAAMNHGHNQSRVEDVAGSDVPLDSHEWKFLHTLAVKLSCRCLTFSVGDGSGGIWELKIEIDASLKLLNLGKRFLFDVSHFCVLTHRSLARIDDLDSTSYNPIPSLSSNGSCYMPLHENIVAESTHSIINDSDSSCGWRWHSEKPPERALSESSSSNNDNCIVAHLTASIIAEKLFYEENSRQLSESWVGNGFIAGFDLTTTLVDIQMLLLLAAPFSDIASTKIDNDWNESSNIGNVGPANLDCRIPDGAIVAIQDILQHMYFAVEKIGIKYRVVGTLHYSLLGEKALFRVRYHNQKRWRSPVSLFSLTSLHAKNDVGEPLRLNCSPGSSFVEVSSSDNKRWALWEAFPSNRDNYYNDGGANFYDTAGRKAFHMVNSKNDCGVAFVDGLPEFVKKPGNLFKMKVLHDYDQLSDVGGLGTSHPYSGSFHQNYSDSANVTVRTKSFNSLSITVDEITWTILHEPPNSKDRFPIFRGFISNFNLVGQSFPTKFRVLSTLSVALLIFDAQRNLWRELIFPIDISVFFRSRYAQNKENNVHGIPTRFHFSMKQVDIFLSELSLDVLLFFAEKLNIVGAYSVKKSAIFANLCKVENHSKLNLICLFSNGEEVIIAGKQFASLGLRSAFRGNQLSREELTVSLSLSELGGFSTSPIQIPLSREHFFAWRTRMTSVSDSRSFPGPFIVVEVSNKEEDGLCVVISSLLRIHNESGFSLKLRFQRPNETDSESVSVLLRHGDAIDESRVAFDAFNFSGGMKRALTSLSLGNFLLSIKPDVTEFLEKSKKAVLVQWSDDLYGGKAVCVSGIFDKLNYRFRKALKMESVKSFFSTIQCPVTIEGVHASDLYFLIQTIAKDVPVMTPQDVGDSSKPLAFPVQKEFYVFPSIKVSNLLQSEIVVLLTENHPDLCVTEGCNNFGKEAKITSGSSTNLYVNPATIYFTVTISALNSKCNPVNSGDCGKKLNKQNKSNHFDIDLNFDGGKYSAVLRLSRGEQGILEATIFTAYTLHNNTEISLLCFSDNQRIKSWGEEDPKNLSLNFGVLLPPKSSISWFFKSNKLHLKWFEEKSSGTFLDLDAISGVTEVSVISQTQTGCKQIAKLGVSLAPYVIKQPVPSQLVDIVPRYIISNESRFTICMRQCYLEDDSDGMTIDSRQKVAFYMQDHPFKMRETSFVDSIFRKHRHGTEDSLIFIQFCIKNTQSSWSGPICIASLGRFCVKFKKLPAPTGSESSSSLASDIESTQFAGVHVMEEGPSLVMHFHMPPDFNLPYRIENRLKNVAIVCHQKDSAVPEMLGPGTSAGYAWDDLTLPHKLVVQIGGINLLREINIDKVRPWKPFFKIRKSRDFAGHLTQDDNIGVEMTEDFNVNNVGFEAYTDGITRVLRICKFSEISIEEKALAPRMSIQFSLRSLALSFVESIVKDCSSPVTPEYSALIVVRLTSMTADMVSTGQWTYNYFKVLSINVDEKWQGAPFASMIRRSEQSDSGIKESMLSLAAIINTGSPKVKQVKYSSIVLQPIDVNIDEETLMRLVKFWRSSLSSSGTPSTLFYFEHFEIHPIKILASFLPGNELSNYSSTQEALRSLLHNVIKVPTVKHASVELNGVLVTHALLTSRELLVKCAQHYSWYILRAIYKAKGSQLLPPAFASIFDDTASSSLDVFFDPSDGSINFPGLTLGMFKFISRCINSKGFSGSKRYLGDLGKTVKRVGSNAIFAAITEISDSVVRGAETDGFDGLVTGFHQGLLHLAMEPAKIGIAAMEGGPDRIIKLDRTPGIDEQYIEGYLQAMLDATYQQEYLRVKVHDNQVFLKNLPPSTTLITEIVERVKSFLVSKGLLIGDASMSLNTTHHLRGKTDWKLGPTVLTLCEHLFVSFAIRALRSQTTKLLGGIKFIKIIGGQEEDQAPSEASRGSQQQPGRLWAVGRFALSGMLAYIDGRLCRRIPHPIARRIVSGFLLSFLEKKDGK